MFSMSSANAATSWCQRVLTCSPLMLTSNCPHGYPLKPSHVQPQTKALSMFFFKHRQEASFLVTGKKSSLLAKCIFFLPSIHPFSSTYPLQGRVGAGAYPSYHGARGGYTLDRSPVCCRANT